MFSGKAVKHIEESIRKCPNQAAKDRMGDATVEEGCILELAFICDRRNNVIQDSPDCGLCCGIGLTTI